MRITPTFSWAVPAAGTVPFYGAFRSLMHAIDASVNSINQAHAAPNLALIMSAYPTATTVTTATEQVESAYAVGSGYETISAAPFGPLVGSFVAAGGSGLFDLRILFAESDTNINARPQFCGVINPGSLRVMAQDSALAFLTLEVFQTARFLFHVASLAQGAHHIAVQWRSSGRSLATPPTVTFGQANWAVGVWRDGQGL